jgi:outer membrane lipoprotein carrier protein
LLIVFLTLALLGGGADDEVSADALLEAVQERYSATRDLRARFVQHSRSLALGDEVTTRGEVVVRRPGRIRWEYDPPDGRVIVLLPDTIRMYVPEDEQLQIAPVAEGGVSPTALGFLMGEARLADEFRPERVDADRSELGLRLLPKQDPSFESLVLWVDPDNHEVRESILLDLFGNRTRLELSDAVYDRGLPDSVFEVKVPEGTEVIDLR